jgi:hypothetical protein
LPVFRRAAAPFVSRGQEGFAVPRLWQSLLAVALVGTVAASAAAQDAPADVRYWPLKEINFPVPVERFDRDARKPKRLHFFVRETGAAWREAAARALNDLELIDADSQKRGFRYVAPRDGAYDFALQLEYDNGDLSPRTADLSPQHRVIFDTRPPLVRAARVGKTGLQWEAQDENLADDPVRLEARWVRDSESPDANYDNAKFAPVEPSGFRPKAKDSFTWRELRPGDVLEVRVVARDKANQETATPPVRLPGDGDAGGLAAAPLGSGFGNPGDFGGAGGPGKEYSNTRKLKITSKLQTVTRSGVVKSYLWVRDSAMKWVMAGEQPEKIAGEAKDAQIVWEHTVKSDGLFGFIVIPENAAGKRDPDPRPGDTAQFLTEVDTAFPEAAIQSAKVTGTGSAPKVDIRWSAADANFDSTPIVLEYADSATAPEGTWKPLTKEPLPNAGGYTWAVSDPKLWQFFLRIRAKDLAGNETKTPFAEKVIVDLDTPKATIETIAGNGKSPQAGAASPPVVSTGGSDEPRKLPVVPDLPTPAADKNPEGGPAVPKLPPLPAGGPGKS